MSTPEYTRDDFAVGDRVLITSVNRRGEAPVESVVLKVVKADREAGA